MSYIVTTKRTQTKLDAAKPVEFADRRAVATLDEAHDYLGNFQDDDAIWNEWRREIGEQGGTVSLPDGTVIEVERQADDFDVDAYNAAQERI